MRETGLLDNWIQKWTPQNLNCTGLKAVTVSKVVTMDDFQGALYVLGLGGCVGLLILLAEHLFNYCNQRKKRQGSVHDVESGILQVANVLGTNAGKSWS